MESIGSVEARTPHISSPQPGPGSTPSGLLESQLRHWTSEWAAAGFPSSRWEQLSLSPCAHLAGSAVGETLFLSQTTQLEEARAGSFWREAWASLRSPATWGTRMATLRSDTCSFKEKFEAPLFAFSLLCLPCLRPFLSCVLCCFCLCPASTPQTLSSPSGGPWGIGSVEGGGEGLLSPLLGAEPTPVTPPSPHASPSPCFLGGSLKGLGRFPRFCTKTENG